MVRLGIIGYGYWGPNIVRNFNGIECAKVLAVCDRDADCRKRAKLACPNAEIASDFKDIIQAGDIDAVALVTPVSTHFKLAKHALENGKHIFVEKPFTSSVEEAEQLIELAEKKNLKIMVDHTFLFTGAVQKMKELVDNNVLGKLFYYDSTRINLGLFQHDVNVIWDLAPHDLSIMDFLINEQPIGIAATGQSHVNGLEDIAYITVFFSNSMIAHFNVNWLSPVKVRRTLVGGERKMMVWDDLEPDEKIKIYDKGVEVRSQEGVYDLLVSYRSGDMWGPKVDQKEALRAETEYFIQCIEQDKRPINDGYAGLRVVRMLEAASRSLQKRGEAVNL